LEIIQWSFQYFPQLKCDLRAFGVAEARFLDGKTLIGIPLCFEAKEN
jgi:hypothetical protein